MAKSQQTVHPSKFVPSVSGIGPMPTNKLINVPVSIEAYTILVNSTYRHLAASFPRFRQLIKQETFLQINLAILAKRVSWVRERTFGMRDTPSVNLMTAVPTSMAIFPSLYAIGRVTAKSQGVVYVPAFTGLEPYAKVNNEDYMQYLEAMTAIKGKHLVQDVMPSQPEGTWAFLLPVRLTRNENGAVSNAEPVALTSEATRDDALYAAVVFRTALVVGQIYGFSYGNVAEPDQLLWAMIAGNTRDGYQGLGENEVEEETTSSASEAQGGAQDGTSSSSNGDSSSS